MASLLDTLLGQLGGDGIKQIGRQLGTDERTAGAATSAALTTLLGALSRNSAGPHGAQELTTALQRDHDGSILDNLGRFLSAPEQGPGEGILRHVLGPRRDRVQSSLGRSTGLDSGSMGKLLTMLAPIVLGALGRAQREQGMNASAMSGFLGDQSRIMEREQPAAGGILSSLLDTDADGDVDMGDLARHGMGLLGRFLKR